MWEFVTAAQNFPFSVAICLMFLIGAIQTFGILLSGIDFGALLDNIIPDWLIDFDADLDVPDVDGPDDLPFFARALSWLNIGRVPSIVLTIVFLTSFGLVGWCMQSILLKSLGFMIPAALAWIPAFVVSLPVMRQVGGFLGKFLKKEETSAVSEATFVGKVATISYGTAREGLSARARLKDKFGHYHNVRVLPDKADDTFPRGTEVLLVRQEGGAFRGILYVDDKIQDLA